MSDKLHPDLALVEKLTMHDGTVVQIGTRLRHRKGWTGKVCKITVPIKGSCGTRIRVTPDDVHEARALSHAWPIVKEDDNDGQCIYGRDIGLTWQNWSLV